MHPVCPKHNSRKHMHTCKWGKNEDTYLDTENTVRCLQTPSCYETKSTFALRTSSFVWSLPRCRAPPPPPSLSHSLSVDVPMSSLLSRLSLHMFHGCRVQLSRKGRMLSMTFKQRCATKIVSCIKGNNARSSAKECSHPHSRLSCH